MHTHENSKISSRFVKFDRIKRYNYLKLAHNNEKKKTR